MSVLPPPYGSEEYWQEYWKNVFSYDVLGYSDPILNPTRGQNDWWKYQSAPWVAAVMNFEQKAGYYWKDTFTKSVINRVPNFPQYKNYLNHVYSADEYCRCCGYPSLEYYCAYCEADKCVSCGEIGCGSYMCAPCRSLNRDY